jgi:hypothetical protein
LIRAWLWILITKQGRIAPNVIFKSIEVLLGKLKGLAELKETHTTLREQCTCLGILLTQKPAQQAHAGDAPSKVFIEVDFATLNES